MNNIRITSFLDDLLNDYQQTPELLELKEELTTHITERLQDNMAKGLSYDEAFSAAVRDMGDVKTLVTGIAPAKRVAPAINSNHEWDENIDHPHTTKRIKKRFDMERIAMLLTSMSPFIYLFMGIMFGWWAWAWVIIPMAGLLFVGEWRGMLVSMSPFIYFLLGWFFGWWAWGWMIIPLSAVVMITD